MWIRIGVITQWCNPLTLQPEQSGRDGSIPGSAPPLDCHDKGSRTRLGQLYFCDSSAWGQGGVDNMFRVRICAAHMDRFLGPEFS